LFIDRSGERCYNAGTTTSQEDNMNITIGGQSLADRSTSTYLQISLPRLIGMSMVTRLLVDTSVQIFAPFLTIIAAGLGTDAVTLGRLISLRSAVGLVAPLFGALADRLGYRRIIRLTLLIAVAGLFLTGGSSNVGLTTLGMVLTGVGLASVVPPLQAYLSAQLPPSHHARGLAIVEYAWALAGIVGLFLAGQLIAATSWRAPFFALGGGLLLM
jgi:MFS family permease